MLARAAAAVEDAFAEHGTTVDLALAHLGSTAVPVQERVTALVADVGQERVDQLDAAVELLTSALEPPVTREGVVITQDASGGPAAALAIALEPVAEAHDVVAALTTHYRTFPAEDRAPVRAEVAAESARLDGLAQILREATASVRASVDDVEVALAEAVGAAREAGAATLETLEHADEESRSALQTALDDLEAIATTTLPVPWDSRTAEQAAAFVGADTALDAYTTTTEAARESHTANTPRGGSGGGSGSNRARVCFKYSAWGSYLGWCY